MQRVRIFKGDFHGTDGIIVSINPQTPDTYYTNENITTTVRILGSNLSQDLINPYLEISIPTKVYTGVKPLTTDKYVDNFNVATTGVDLIKSVEKREDGNNTIIKVTFNEIDKSTRVEFPYVFSFTDMLTPSEYTIQPKVTLYDSTGNILVSGDDKVYKPKYDNKTGTLLMAPDIYLDGALVNGGVSVAGDPTVLANTGVEAIPFKFSYVRNGSERRSRMIKTLYITNTLPKYFDGSGNELTAKFDPSLNPGWVDNHDGTVTYTENFLESTYGGDPRIDINNNLQTLLLNLSFPNARISNGATPVIFKNKVNYSGIPFNPSDGEVYNAEDTISFKMTSNDYSGRGILSKRNEIRSSISFDRLGLYAERTKWIIKIGNNTNKPLTDIVLIEDVKNYDGRLYLTSVEKFYNRTVIEDLSIKTIIKAYRADGTYAEFKPSAQTNGIYQINLSTQNENNANASAVNAGILKLEDVKPATVEFTKVEIILKDVVLPPGQAIDGRITMGFVDPYNLVFSDRRDIKNRVVLNANMQTTSGNIIAIKPEDEDNKWFIEQVEKMVLSGYTVAQNTGMEGDDVSFRFYVDYREVSKNRYMDKLTIIDLLPKGVSAPPTTEIRGLYNTDRYIQSREIIKNYNNTGQDAVKIVLKSMLAGEMKGGDNNVPLSATFLISGLKINENIVPTFAETPELNNDNHIYAFFDNGGSFPNEIVSAEKITDVKDININKDTNDIVLSVKTKVIGNAPNILQSKKFIRSIEPITKGGELYYERAWTESISTDYSGVDQNSGRFQYDLQVRNYFNADLNKVSIYDVLPNVKDSGRRESANPSDFSNTLVAPVRVFIANVDVSENFDIYYREDRYPSVDPKIEMSSTKWTKTPTSYPKVTAIKIVMKDGYIIKPMQILHVIFDMKAPEYHGVELYGLEGINAFSVVYGDDVIFGETKAVRNRIGTHAPAQGHNPETGDNNAASLAFVTLLLTGALIIYLKKTYN